MNLRLMSAREDPLHFESQLQSVSFYSDHDSQREIKCHLKQYLDSYRHISGVRMDDVTYNLLNITINCHSWFNNVALWDISLPTVDHVWSVCPNLCSITYLNLTVGWLNWIFAAENIKITVWLKKMCTVFSRDSKLGRYIWTVKLFFREQRRHDRLHF